MESDSRSAAPRGPRSPLSCMFLIQNVLRRAVLPVNDYPLDICTDAGSSSFNVIYVAPVKSVALFVLVLTVPSTPKDAISGCTLLAKDYRILALSLFLAEKGLAWYRGYGLADKRPSLGPMLQIRCDKRSPCSNCRTTQRPCSSNGVGQKPKEQRHRVLISLQ